MSIKSFVRWMAVRAEVPRYAADYPTLDRLFQSKKDPWKFSSDPYESARFEKTLQILERVPHKSILEVGCAEGHFTRHLCDMAEKVVALDVSPTAVDRTRQIAPKAEVLCKSLEEAEFDRKFDLVVCAETIYYPKDTIAAIRKLNSLGEFILVTYTMYEKIRLDPIFAKIPAIYNAPFRYFGFFEAGKIVNWRGIQIVLWWSGCILSGEDDE